jgi:hypothetical protein
VPELPDLRVLVKIAEQRMPAQITAATWALEGLLSAHCSEIGTASGAYEVAVLELSALRAATEPPSEGAQGDAGFGALSADCAARLRARLARPQRVPGDWTVELPAGCTCPLCGTLRAFLADPRRRVFDWPLAKDGRQHIHSRIDAAELPVTHVTRRQGRPYTLVLNKIDALFTREQEARQGRDGPGMARSRVEREVTAYAMAARRRISAYPKSALNARSR